MEKSLRELVGEGEQSFQRLASSLVEMSYFISDYLRDRKAIILVPLTGAAVMRNQMEYIFEKENLPHPDYRFDLDVSTSLEVGEENYVSVRGLPSNLDTLLVIDEVGTGICWSKVFSTYYNNYTTHILNKGFDTIFLVGLEHFTYPTFWIHMDLFVNSSFTLYHKYECKIVRTMIDKMREINSKTKKKELNIHMYDLKKISQSISSADDYRNNLHNILHFLSLCMIGDDIGGTKEVMEKAVGIEMNLSINEMIDLMLMTKEDLSRRMFFLREEDVDELYERFRELTEVKETGKELAIKTFKTDVAFRDSSNLIGLCKGEFEGKIFVDTYDQTTAEEFDLLLKYHIDKALGKVDEFYYLGRLIEMNYDKEFFDMFLERFNNG